MARICDSHSQGLGSIPGVGTTFSNQKLTFFSMVILKPVKKMDESLKEPSLNMIIDEWIMLSLARQIFMFKLIHNFCCNSIKLRAQLVGVSTVSEQGCALHKSIFFCRLIFDHIM